MFGLTRKPLGAVSIAAARAYSAGKPGGSGFDVMSFIGRIDQLYKDQGSKQADTLVQKLASKQQPRTARTGSMGNKQDKVEDKKRPRRQQNQSTRQGGDRQWTSRVDRLRAATRTSATGVSAITSSPRAGGASTSPISALGSAAEERVDLHISKRQSRREHFGPRREQTHSKIRESRLKVRTKGKPVVGSGADKRRTRRPADSRDARGAREDVTPANLSPRDAILAVRALVAKSRSNGYVVPGGPSAEVLTSLPLPPVSYEARVWNTVRALDKDKYALLLDRSSRKDVAADVVTAFALSGENGLVRVTSSNANVTAAVRAINNNATMTPNVKKTLVSVIEGKVPVSNVRARA